MLDEVGSFIWERVSSQRGVGWIVDGMICYYETDVDRAQRDVDKFLDHLLKEGIIQQSAKGSGSSKTKKEIKGDGNSKKPYERPSVKNAMIFSKKMR